jgi:PAT family beta-lactamase induction signal transducer AmpG
MQQTAQLKTPWLWVPSLYFGQGIPYVVVMFLSGVMYKNLGVPNAEMALYTSWLYLPWVIKPLWAPIVEMFGTRRSWVVILQLAIGSAFALVAFTFKLPNFFQATLAVFWLMAFSSATHDIAADGFYMMGMPQKQQAAFVGVRSTFYRLATLVCQGQVVVLSGYLAVKTGDYATAWALVCGGFGLMFVLLGAYHFVVLPRPEEDRPPAPGGNHFKEFFATFAAFFRKKDIVLILAFLLTYRLGEAQLLKMAAPFMLDPVAKGGLGLGNEGYGWAYGTVGILALTIGGLLGGYTISRFGLKRCLWPMVLSTHIPDLVFVYLAYAQPGSLAGISALIALEQFGYGFGFAAYLLYMIMIADGEHKTAHYAICTGFMAMGMMLPGMVSGYIQQALGYQHFFVYVCLMTIPAFIMAGLVKIDPEFGKK